MSETQPDIFKKEMLRLQDCHDFIVAHLEGDKRAWAHSYNELAIRYDDAMKRINDLQAELEYLRLEVNRQ